MAKKITINIDKAISIYNKSHPKETLTKEGLFRTMENSLDRKKVNEWKGGKIPSAFNVVYEVAEICGCEVSDIITIKCIKSK